MRILSLDVGEKRIGVARADTSTKIAIPVKTISVDGTELEEIARLSRLYSTNFLVLGLPRSNEGNETAQSVYVRNFARTLGEKIPDIKSCLRSTFPRLSRVHRMAVGCRNCPGLLLPELPNR